MAEAFKACASDCEVECGESYGCVVVAQLAVQARVRLRPQWIKTAVVVMEGRRPLESVFALNGIAMRKGLKKGMSRVEVDTFEEVQVLNRSSAEEDVAHAVLVETMGVFSPRVEARVSGVDWECVLDLTGTSRLLGDSAAVGRQIVLRMKELGFAGVVVISGNADAGLLAGRGLAWECVSAETQPTLSSANCHSVTIRYPGVQVIPKGDEAHALAALPLDVLKLHEEYAERFEVWGINTLGELAALPETALISRMGQSGKELRLKARGELQYLLEPVIDESLYEETLELEAATDTLEPLLFVLNPMLEQLCERVIGRGLAFASVTVEFGLDKVVKSLQSTTDPVTFSRTVRPGVPTLNRKLLLKMLQLDLEAHPASAAVWQVTLKAETAKASRIQLGLFAPPMPEPTRFEDTHARLVSVVGEGNVGRVRPLDTHASEGFVLERFCLPSGAYKTSEVREVGLRPGTALRKMRPPVSIDVEIQKEEIRRFWFEARCYQVLRCYGPWRSSGDWWCGQVWSVDTWDVAARSDDEELLICLVGHDLVKRAWVLEGIYD